jgi:hypothetical protein
VTTAVASRLVGRRTRIQTRTLVSLGKDHPLHVPFRADGFSVLGQVRDIL